MSTGSKVHRGDVVLLPIAFVSGQGTKVRPAVVIQSDTLNGGVARAIDPTNVCHGQEFDGEDVEVPKDQFVELAARAEPR